ncbi:hypothetical protein MMSR116_11075 [Methylobacterium mesophilicum SR1.6/6]|uniref:Uncharacterized protein n=1 Tax=Methylobacterium mesophilicum SR1.6/6 TaxID=908290 RepID=A0A6B9FKU8_9HYPH|nr:hypothetical protein [Methylobacterium mesophilicum]QGY02356.1 hypothetical protein MMSR116_11075 [Methylobacterium mesophilicum SR1.6/6]
MSDAPQGPNQAAHDLILRAARESVRVQQSVIKRAGTADTLTIRDQVRRALADDTITEAAVDRILSAHREVQRQRRGAA